MGANDPWGVASLDPRVFIGRIYVAGPLNIATYYIYKLWASWFRRRRFFLSFSHYKSMGVHDPLGLGQFGSQGLDWQDLVGEH